MKRSRLLPSIPLALLAACSGVREPNVLANPDGQPAAALDEEEDDDASEAEERIALDGVPANVLAAAAKAVPGFAPTQADREREHGAVVYCLEGWADGEWVDVDVSPEGEILAIDRGADEDEDED